jgi:threonyl-tRNA synthetase
VLLSFYYDFFFPNEQISDTNLKKIKKEMDKLIRLNLPITKEEVHRDEARYAEPCLYLTNKS